MFCLRLFRSCEHRVRINWQCGMTDSVLACHFGNRCSMYLHCTVYTVHEMEAFMGIANETWSAHTQLGNGRRRRRLPWQTCEQTKHHLQRLRNGRCVENAASRLNTFCCYFVLSTMTIPSQQWVNTIQYIFSHRRIRLCSGWWAENYVISMYDVEDKEYASFLRMLHQQKLRLLCRVHA